jgi:hypothetical protein
MTKINWNEVSSLYIEGEISPSGERVYPTLEDVSKKYNVRPGTVRTHAAAEHWRDKRATFQRDLEEKARQLRLEKRAKEELDFHENCFKITKGGIFHLADHLQAMLDDFADWKANPYEEVTKDGKTVRIKRRAPLDKATIAMLEAISRTLEKLQKAGCVALGIPDRNTTISGPMGSPIEIIQQSPEELDRRIQEQYKLLGYDPEVKPAGIEGQKTTLGEALRRLNTQESEEILSDKEKSYSQVFPDSANPRVA